MRSLGIIVCFCWVENEILGQAVVSDLDCIATEPTSWKDQYNGTRHTTNTGKTCINWSESQHPDYGLANYCRANSQDPDSSKGPWCYTTYFKWEFCYIPICEIDCRAAADDRNYKGTLNVTYSGYTCRYWADTSPSQAGGGDTYHQNETLNYCRTPRLDNFSTPWCYTTSPNYKWETCVIPLCGSVCPDLRHVSNTETPKRLTGYQHGETVTFRCNIGYSIKGDSTLTCLGGGCDQYNARWDKKAPSCVRDINYCHPSRCLNGGSCVNKANDYECTCQQGYTGKNCEINKDDCQPFVCLNGGSCTDQVNGYKCSCLPGYTGKNCETNKDDCRPSLCLNGGSCTDQVDDYKCTCTPGYTGKNCETNIDDCHPHTCLNGGHCTDLVNNYKCTCLPGYTGMNCETESSANLFSETSTESITQAITVNQNTQFNYSGTDKDNEDFRIVAITFFGLFAVSIFVNIFTFILCCRQRKMIKSQQASVSSKDKLQDRKELVMYENITHVEIEGTQPVSPNSRNRDPEIYPQSTTYSEVEPSSFPDQVIQHNHYEDLLETRNDNDHVYTK